MTLAELDGIAVTAYLDRGTAGGRKLPAGWQTVLTAGKPLVPTHHLAGHRELHCTFNQLPYLCLVVSGRHSHLVEVLTYTKFRILGRTRTMPQGKALPRARKCVYPYPGGIHLDKASQSGNPKAFSSLKPKIAENAYDFSFPA